MTDYNAIQNELQGRTGLLKEYEDDLIERICTIEEIIQEKGSIVPTLNKSDLIGIIALLAVGIGIVIWTALWIS